MKKINENTKVTLTFKQLKKLVKEATFSEFEIKDGTLVEYHGNGGSVVIPDGVKTIGKFAFTDSLITSLVVPKGVTKIEHNAFSSCRKLVSVQLPEGLRKIEDYAFMNCPKLKTFILSKSTRLGHEIFGGKGDNVKITWIGEEDDWDEEEVEVAEIPEDKKEVYIGGIEDGEEVPYIHGSANIDCDPIDRSDLSEYELWATGWSATVQNTDDGPFKSFNEMKLACFDDEKGGEYNLPEIPAKIKLQYVKAVNKYLRG